MAITPQKSSIKAPSGSLMNRIKGWSKRRKILTSVSVVLVLFVLFFIGGLFGAAGQILKPKFKGVSDFATCAPETEAFFGEGCGNLRNTKQFVFSEVKIPAEGQELPGWLVKTDDNNGGESEGVIMLVHAGGSDRRQMTKMIDFYLSQKLDVLTFDYSCQGEAPCDRAGITYGERESRDVVAAYNYLSGKYSKVYAMGSSVGAASVLIALPDMPNLAGAIAENPLANFKRLLKEAPEAQAMPGWFTDALIGITMSQGKFDGSKSADTTLTQVKDVPILFIHSKEDQVISYKQTEGLIAAYAGPKTLWLADKGEHAGVWDADTETYQRYIADFLQGKN